MKRVRSLDGLVTDVASTLMGVDAASVHTAYAQVLRTMVEYFGVDAGYLRHTDHDKRITSMVAEWPLRPDAPDPDPLGVVSFADADPVFAACENLLEPRIFRPKPAHEDYRKRVEAASGYVVTSMAVVPLVSGRSIGWVGLIKAGDRTWSASETNVLVAIASMFTQVDARITAEESLRRAALHDEMTGLPNRRGIIGSLAAVLVGIIDGRAVTVMFLDVDRLKALNDFYGHTAGDTYLCAVADTLVHELGPQALVARWGGDEFVVVLPTGGSGPKSPSSHDIALRLLDAVANTRVVIAGDVISRTVSIGVTTAHPGVDTADEAIANADQAALVAKRTGGNSVALFDTAIRARNALRNDVELHLRSAIADGDLVLHYQPEVDLRSGAIGAVEALVRWQHPTRGLLPPSEFISVAESSDLATELGSYVLHDATRTYARWMESVPDLDVTLRVNVSPAQLMADEFVDDVSDALGKSGMLATRLCLEVTENAVVQDTGQTAKILTTLRDLGVKIAIDDFGTGFSSLAHLKILPVDALKIDREFVTHLDTSASDRAIVMAIATLAQSFELDLIAEGLETRGARDALLELGCTKAQGYLYSTPLPESGILRLFRAETIDWPV